MIRYSLGILLLAAAPLRAQCPDGSPPPCRTASAARAVAAPPPLSIAVLPFENRSPDSADAYFADGITEEIGNRLTQVGRLQVKARGLVKAQVRRTPEPFDAARGLGVAWFVHGTVRHVSGQLLVNVELVRATTGEEAWASRFPRRDNDVFAVQAEVAESVAVVVGGRLTPNERAIIARRPTRNNEAYRLYLLGNSLFTRRTEGELRQAMDAYTRAIGLDSGFAAAWARLSLTRGVQTTWGFDAGMSNDSALRLARTEAVRAVMLDSMSAEAWLAKGFAEQQLQRFWLAEEGLERATRLDTLNPEIWHFRGVLYGFDCPVGRCLVLERAGVPFFRRALALDPTLRNTWRHLAMAEIANGDFGSAEAHLDTALSFGPWGSAFQNRAAVRIARRNFAGAIADLEAATVEIPADDTSRAWIAFLRGDSVPLRTIAIGLAGTTDLFRLALRSRLEAVLGLTDAALATLEQMRGQPDPQPALCAPEAPCSANLGLWRVLRDPALWALRSNPRYERLAAETRPHVPWLENR